MNKTVQAITEAKAVLVNMQTVTERIRRAEGDIISLYQIFVEAAVNCSWHCENIVVLMPSDENKTSEAQMKRLQQEAQTMATNVRDLLASAKAYVKDKETMQRHAFEETAARVPVEPAGLEYETVMDALVGLEEADREKQAWRDKVDGALQYRQETMVYSACMACDGWAAEQTKNSDQA